MSHLCGLGWGHLAPYIDDKVALINKFINKRYIEDGAI